MTVIINGTNTPTAGGVTYGNGTEYATTSAGTSGQVLTSAGSSAPTWATPATGPMVLLNTLTAASSASLTDTTSLTSTYGLYVFQFSSLLPATNDVQFQIQYSTNGGSTWLTTGYDSMWTNGVSSTYNAQGLFNTTAIIIGTSGTTGGIRNTAAYGLSGTTHLVAPSSASMYKATYGSGAYFMDLAGGGQTNYMAYTHSGVYTSATTAINAVKFFMNSGNITSGSIQIYGIKTA